MNHSKKIQEIAKKLLDEKKVEVFIGYQFASDGKTQVPLVTSNVADIEKLVFTETSGYNLTNYLKYEHARRKKVGIVVKGCDSRALNLLLTENQLKRENVYVIGVCCTGVVDVAGKKYGNCEECPCPDPVVADEVLGEKRGFQGYKPNEEVRKLGEKSLVERGEYFQKVFEACIRCNACRNSCPLCYCDRCSVEENNTYTCPEANTAPNAASALLTWALHLAGRCVDCRNCSKACPRGLPLHLLHKKIDGVVHDNFNQHLAGVQEKDPGALYKYDLKDPDSFIL